jgi:lipopolysaccharide export system permease protein
MKLIERYVLGRLIRSFLLALVTLSATAWLTQALQQVSLVTAQGQTVWLFLKVTLLLMPEVASIIAPVAVLIAVAYTFITLNSDSELVVINASGAPQMTLLRPVLTLALIAAIVIASMTLFIAPIAQRAWRSEITFVRANIVTALLREGSFMQIADGLVFHLRDRRSDGSLHGLFVSDSRDPGSTVTYVAQEGSIVQSPIGTFLVMSDGTIQRRSRPDGGISVIEFSSYAFDLTTFASRSETPAYRPTEQSTAYLLDPNPEDPVYQKQPELFAAELTGRLANPLYAFVAALVPLIFLVQAESTRRRRATALIAGVAGVVILRAAGALISAASGSPPLAILAYALPIGVSVAACALILTGIRPRLPDRLADAGDALIERIGGSWLAGLRAQR